MAYCCERRDPDPGAKTRDVLLLYKQLSLRFNEDGNLVPWEEGQEARVSPHDEGTGNSGRARAPPPTCGPRQEAWVMLVARVWQGRGQARSRAWEARDALAPRRPTCRLAR